MVQSLTLTKQEVTESDMISATGAYNDCCVVVNATDTTVNPQQHNVSGIRVGFGQMKDKQGTNVGQRREG